MVEWNITNIFFYIYVFNNFIIQIIMKKYLC